MATQSKTSSLATLIGAGFIALVVVAVGSTFKGADWQGSRTVPALATEKPNRVDFIVVFGPQGRKTDIRWRVGDSGNELRVTGSPWRRVQYANSGDIATLDVDSVVNDPSVSTLRCMIEVNGQRVRDSGVRIFMCDERVIVK